MAGGKWEACTLDVALPLCYHAVDGIEAIRQTLPASFLSMTNVSRQQILNWMIIIVPIWFIGMTLYQRIYASKKAALVSMISGGGTSLVLIIFNPALPFGLEPIAFAKLASLAVFLLVSILDKTKRVVN